MPQDLVTLKKVAKELSATITGAKVNKVLQPSAFEIGIVLYQKRAFRLIINVSAQFARVSVSNAEKENPLTAPNFCMLLRKHLTGAEVTGVAIANDDRIIKISFSNFNDFKESVTLDLYAEIMGKYSNLFLVKNDRILGSLRTLPQGLDGKRITLVGAPYKFPDKSDKISILSPEAKELFSEQTPITAKFLTSNFYDFAPVTAQEIESVLDGERNGSIAYEKVLEFLNSNAPTVKTLNGKSDFYFTDYKSVDGVKTQFESILLAMESVYENAEKSTYSHTLRSSLQSYITAYEKRLKKKIETLTDRINSSCDLEKYKLYGELITQYIYLLKKGQISVSLVNYTENGEEQVEVKLDENLTPQQNAQKYFKTYRKKKATLSQSEIQLEEATKELSYLSSIKFSIDNAKEKSDFDEIKEELILYGLIKENSGKNKNKKDKPLGFLRYNIDGFEVLVGKNNLQNDRLLTLADKGDLWFHVKSYHSSHVILRTGGKKPNDNVITACAEICAFYSQANGGNKVEVDYTERKFVKKQGGKNLGGVFYTDQKTLVVTPNSNEGYKI